MLRSSLYVSFLFLLLNSFVFLFKEGDLEEKEDYKIKDSDNLLISGHVEDKSSVLEVHGIV